VVLQQGNRQLAPAADAADRARDFGAWQVVEAKGVQTCQVVDGAARQDARVSLVNRTRRRNRYQRGVRTAPDLALLPYALQQVGSAGAVYGEGIPPRAEFDSCRARPLKLCTIKYLFQHKTLSRHFDVFTYSIQPSRQ
jgi:hypothetical protein